jgi:predicted dehydrogenase
MTSFLNFHASQKSFSMVGYVLRFLPLLHSIKKIIQENILGEIYSARIEVGQYLPDWRPNSDYRLGVSSQKSLGGGVLLELSHEIDYCTWMFGFPEKIFCSASKISDLEIDVEDNAQLIFEYPKKRVTLSLDFFQRVPRMLFEIIGSKGTLISDLINETIQMKNLEKTSRDVLFFTKTKDSNEIYLRQFDFFFHKSIPNYIPKFKETLAFDEFVSIERACKILNLVETAKNSNELGERINFSWNKK